MSAKTTEFAQTPPSVRDELPRLRKPDWPRGLQLMPQHFEAQDRYHEERIALTLQLVTDRPWGVAELALDAEAIDAGELVVHRLRAVLPDGTPVIVGSGGASTIARSFEGSLGGRKSLDVYVGILREVAGRAVIENSGDATQPRRFTRETSMVAEYGSGHNAVPVPWARPNLRLLFDDEPLEPYSVVRIARIERGESGRPILDPRFVPPVLRVRASPVLEQTFRALDKALHATRAALTSPRGDASDTTMSDATRLLLAMMLSRLVPRVGDLLGSNASPREAYRLLAELVGALSPLTPAGVLAIPPFDYLNLGPTFEGLAAQAHEILRYVLAPAYRALPFARYDNNIWFTELREPGIFGKEFVLVVTGGDPNAVRTHLALHAKVAAWDEIGQLVSSSVSGVGLVAESRRPAGLSVPPQSVCFRLNQQGAEWASVVRKGSLAMYTPPPFHQTQLALFVKERSVLA